MNKYELIYMVDARLSEGEKGEVAKLVADMIAKAGGLYAAKKIAAASGDPSTTFWPSEAACASKKTSGSSPAGE